MSRIFEAMRTRDAPDESVWTYLLPNPETTMAVPDHATFAVSKVVDLECKIRQRIEIGCPRVVNSSIILSKPADTRRSKLRGPTLPGLLLRIVELI
jgi:hypothetical protein